MYSMEQLAQIIQGDIKQLARSISYIENESPGYEKLLESFRHLPRLSLVLPARRVQAKVHWLIR